LLDDLASLEEAHQLSPDALFFTGDLVQGSTEERDLPSQFQAGGQFLERLRRSLTRPIPKERVYLVPGNHDIFRSQEASTAQAWLDDLARNHGGRALEQVNEMLQTAGGHWPAFALKLRHYREFLDNHGFDHLLSDRRRLLYGQQFTIAGLRVGVVGINTAWACWRNGEKGQLWLGRWQLEEALSKLDSPDVVILLSHHPFNWLNEFEDPMIARQSESLIDFHLHGHEHAGWVSVHDRCLRVAAAASYQSSERVNGYSVVRFTPALGRVEVFLRTYDQHGGGWTARQVAGKTDAFGRWVEHRPPWAGKRQSLAPIELGAIRMAFHRHRAEEDPVLAADAAVLAASGTNGSTWRRRARQLGRQGFEQQRPWPRFLYLGAARAAAAGLVAAELEAINRSLAYLENQHDKPLEALYASAWIGRSPGRRAVAKRLTELFQRLDASTDGSLHNQCLLCTATAVVEAVGFGFPNVAERPLRWLVDQLEPRADEIGADPQYGAAVIDGLLAGGEWARATVCAEQVLRRRSEWDDGSERPSIEGQAWVLEATAQLLESGQDRAGFKSVFDDAADDFLAALSKVSDHQAAPALRGLLIGGHLDADTDHACSARAAELHQHLVVDSRWDRDRGCWGSDDIETMYRTLARMAYADFALRRGYWSSA
jgi:predicted MPP superfamily phosphohydrolase